MVVGLENSGFLAFIMGCHFKYRHEKLFLIFEGQEIYRIAAMLPGTSREQSVILLFTASRRSLNLKCFMSSSSILKFSNLLPL